MIKGLGSLDKIYTRKKQKATEKIVDIKDSIKDKKDKALDKCGKIIDAIKD